MSFDYEKSFVHLTKVLKGHTILRIMQGPQEHVIIETEDHLDIRRMWSILANDLAFQLQHHFPSQELEHDEHGYPILPSNAVEIDWKQFERVT